MLTIDGKACRLSTFYSSPENNCKPCPLPSCSYVLGSLSCICNAGYAENRLGVSLPVPLASPPQGELLTAQISEGSATCSMCRAGCVSTAVGSSSCSPCDLGYFSSVGSTACGSAPAGHFARSVPCQHQIPDLRPGNLQRGRCSSPVPALPSRHHDSELRF
jgi:hypothetical protein